MLNWKQFEEKVIKKRKKVYANDKELWKDITNFLNSYLPVKTRNTNFDVLKKYPNLSVEYLNEQANFKIVEHKKDEEDKFYAINGETKDEVDNYKYMYSSTSFYLTLNGKMHTSDKHFKHFKGGYKKIMQDFIQFETAINKFQDEPGIKCALNKAFNLMIYSKNLFATGFMLIYYNALISGKKSDLIPTLLIAEYYNLILEIFKGEREEITLNRSREKEESENVILRKQNEIFRETLLNIQSELEVMKDKIRILYLKKKKA